MPKQKHPRRPQPTFGTPEWYEERNKDKQERLKRYALKRNAKRRQFKLKKKQETATQKATKGTVVIETCRGMFDRFLLRPEVQELAKAKGAYGLKWLIECTIDDLVNNPILHIREEDEEQKKGKKHATERRVSRRRMPRLRLEDS